MSVMKPEKLIINDEVFFLIFDIHEPNIVIDRTYREYKTILAKIYKNFSDQLTKILKEQLRTQERDDKLHYLNISFRNEIEYKRDEFYEKLINDIKEDQRLSRFTSLNSQGM